MQRTAYSFLSYQVVQRPTRDRDAAWSRSGRHGNNAISTPPIEQLNW
jgi:hypothetical protein